MTQVVYLASSGEGHERRVDVTLPARIRALHGEAVVTATASSQVPVQGDRLMDGPPMSGQEFMEFRFRMGKALNLPFPLASRPTPEQIAELERLAEVFGVGQPLSQMIHEDRDGHG